MHNTPDFEIKGCGSCWDRLADGDAVDGILFPAGGNKSLNYLES